MSCAHTGITFGQASKVQGNICKCQVEEIQKEIAISKLEQQVSTLLISFLQ